MCNLALPAALADFQQNRVLSLEKNNPGAGSTHPESNSCHTGHCLTAHPVGDVAMPGEPTLNYGRDSYRQHVCTIIFVTTYGSMFDAGRRSSKYPYFWASVSRGIRTEHPRFATP